MQIDPCRWLCASDAELREAVPDEPPASLRLGARLVLRHLLELVGLELPVTSPSDRTGTAGDLSQALPLVFARYSLD